MSKNGDYKIRLEVAKNPNTTVELLKKMLNDKNEQVSCEAKKRLNMEVQ